jgi:hypothetical protein
VAAAAGLGPQLAGQGGQDAGLVFGLGRYQPGAAAGLQVQRRPQLGQDVEGVQAQVVLLPAGAEAGGQVPVAGPVDLLHPGAQPGDWLPAICGRQLPPRRRRCGTVPAGFGVGWAGCGEPGEGGRVVLQRAADAGGLAGEFGELAGQGGVVLSLAGVEPGELLALRGEPVQQAGDRVGGGHGQLQGKEVPSPGIHSAGT